MKSASKDKQFSRNKKNKKKKKKKKTKKKKTGKLTYNTKAQFHVTVITQIYKSMVYFTIRHNVRMLIYVLSSV